MVWQFKLNSFYGAFAALALLGAVAACIFIHSSQYPSEAAVIASLQPDLKKSGYSLVVEKFYSVRQSAEPVDLRMVRLFKGSRQSDRLGLGLPAAYSNLRSYEDVRGLGLDIRTDVSGGKVYAVVVVGDNIPSKFSSEMRAKCTALGVQMSVAGTIKRH